MCLRVHSWYNSLLSLCSSLPLLPVQREVVCEENERVTEQYEELRGAFEALQRDLASAQVTHLTDNLITLPLIHQTFLRF